MITTTLQQVEQRRVSGGLEVRLACNMKDVDAAMRLRYEVFNLELQEGLQSSYERGYDMDTYDAWCDHLIVRDLEMDRVVGTYRLLRQSQADRQIGFYSENEFDLSRLRRAAREEGGEMLELGRSCIAATHRSYATISLLWGGIVRYAMERGLRLLFGCGSLHSADPAEVWSIYEYLRRSHLAEERYRVSPLPGCLLPLSAGSIEVEDMASMQRRLPPIMRGYLRAGARICGEPAFDREFGTADLLVLQDLGRTTARYQNHYAGVGAA